MKNSTIQRIGLIMLLFCFASLSAQLDKSESITIPLSNPGEEGKLTIGLLYGSITVTAHSGDDVIVQTESKEKPRSGRTKDGMRKIGDTSMEFSVEEFNNKVVVRSKRQNKKVHFMVKVPENFSLDLRATNSGDIQVGGVYGEMEISNLNGSITLTDIGGSVIADALNQDIKVTFTKGCEKAPMAFTSLNGDIDVTFPNGLTADVKAKTDNGEIFTDYEINMTRDVRKEEKKLASGVYKVTVDKWVTGTINGGGEELLFKTMNGDIILRSNTP